MQKRPALIIDDSCFLPRSQRSLLTRAIRESSSCEYELIFVSELGLEYPRSWFVKPWVGTSLFAKLWVLRRPLDGGAALYMDGHLMIHGDIAEILVKTNREAMLADPGKPLKDLRFFVVHYERLHHGGLLQRLEALDGGYDKCAEFNEWEMAPLPAEWSIAPSGRGSQSRITDFRPLSKRPWVSPFAQGGAEWFHCLREVLNSGDLSMEDVQKDIDDGLIRPSIFYQLQRGIDDPLKLPVSVQDTDLAYSPPELAVPKERLEVLRSESLRLRVNAQRKKEIYGAKGWIKLVFRFAKRVAGFGWNLFARLTSKILLFNRRS